MPIVFDDEQPTTPGKIVFDDEQPSKSMEGFAKNTLTDYGQNIKANADLASYAFPPLAAMKAVSGTNIYDPKRLSTLGKGLVQGVKNLPSQIGQEVMHPIESAYKRPLSTALDAATVADVGAGGARALIPNAERSAQNMALSAFGDTKRFTNNPMKEAMARSSVQTLMDQGALKPWSTTEDLVGRVQELANKSGKAIGDHLEKVGQSDTFFDPAEAINEIEKLRPRTKTGQLLEGGAYDKINKKIDTAIDTIKAHGPKDANDVFENIVDSVFGKSGPSKPTKPFRMDWKESNDLKGTIQDLADWKSNKDATILDRVIAGKFREVLDKSLERATADPLKHQEFLKNKKIYSAAMNQMDPLYNRLSSELGNKGISLTDWIVAAAELGAGNPLTAIGVVGGKKLAERFGPQTGASLLNKAAKIKPSTLGKLGGTGILMNAARNQDNP